MKAIYWQNGETIDYKNNTDKTIESGDVVSITSRIGVAGTKIEKNETGTLHVVGVFELKKASSEEITIGTKVYYDKTNDCITATEESNIPSGYAVATASSSDTNVLVKLLG